MLTKFPYDSRHFKVWEASPLFLKKRFIRFLAVVDLRCCVWAFSSCGEPGLLFVVLCGLLIVVASLVAEYELQARGFSSCSTWAQ